MSTSLKAESPQFMVSLDKTLIYHYQALHLYDTITLKLIGCQRRKSGIPVVFIIPMNHINCILQWLKIRKIMNHITSEFAVDLLILFFFFDITDAENVSYQLHIFSLITTNKRRLK